VKVVVFDSHKYDRDSLEAANRKYGYELKFLDTRLTADTVGLAEGSDVVCAFVNDRIDKAVLQALKQFAVGLIATRSAGFNHIDLKAAAEAGIKIARVPEYSPHAVAEHAVAMIMALNRKTHHAFLRTRELNFRLDGLVGFDIYKKVVGVIGTGRIGQVLARIMSGFGAEVLAYDVAPNAALAASGVVKYVDLPTLYSRADIISLHVPLKPETQHLLNQEAIALMKPGIMIINTGRGGLIDTRALIRGLKDGRIGYAGLDVYEEEEGVFFEDLSALILQDDILARLLTFPNVLITSHQGFLTKEALVNIAETTLGNVAEFASRRELTNEVKGI